MSEWIAVSERMPEPGTQCLVWSRQTWETIPSIKFDTWEELHEAPLSFSSATVPIGLGWNEHDDYESVTHWMPLPEPPKESK